MEDVRRRYGHSAPFPAPPPPPAAQKRGIWHLLDARFDGLVGNCECIDSRDMPDMAFTVHFSCMAVFSKPGHFSSDYDLMNTVYSRGKSCTRFYYMTWYDKFKAAMGPFRAPYWTGPPVPLVNKTHDALIDGWREQRRMAEQMANA